MSQTTTQAVRGAATAEPDPRTVAGWFLTSVGLDPAMVGEAAMAADGPGDIDGLPAGSLGYTCGLALAGAAAAAALSATPIAVSRAAVASHLLLPLSAGAPSPPPPRAFGPGYVSCELGVAENAGAFARLLTVTPARTPRQVARHAQEWRLPVVDYRRRRPAVCRPVVRTARPLPPVAVARRGHVYTGPPLHAVNVVDLTAMWAGPLATALLRSLGARVCKVEPDIRRDGIRGAPAMHSALNEGKEHLPLDLRDDVQRQRFFAEVTAADVVIDSFSPRVMPNLGLRRADLARHNPRVVTVSMPAFPPGSRERRWVAYGSGVHAASGLGDEGDGRMLAPAVSYPDPVAGFAAFAAVCALLLARAAGRPPVHADVSLSAAIAPLLTVGRRPGRLAAAPPAPPASPWPVFT